MGNQTDGAGSVRLVSITRRERHVVEYIDRYEVPLEVYSRLLDDREVDYSDELWQELEEYLVSKEVDEVSNRLGDFEVDVDISMEDS